MTHVIAITDPGDGLAAYVATVLDIGLHVGENLAGVEQVGQCIYHGNAREAGELLDFAVFKRADHNGVDHGRKNAGGVFDGFATAKLGIA